ncbi:hypothetical protein BT96DRAFT_1056887 [Gymnopus androsaceus JB14]|uniref:Uncharacterized protein n=1 Tax=Gymnopus androsaceus JB14 TaxID=1447944 RepID=A0A6A4H443_9AGAR|nr:hypothetical protein BT96DRAFT_1056887 [Gymnopus androsaceus JB14]
MAAIHPLPARNERSAPKWDSEFEEQLPTFFEEFEAVATTAGINNDDTAMKKGVLHYTDQQSMRFWRTLPTYEDATKTWTEFKDEVLVRYPGALKDAESTMEDLRKVVSEYAGSGVTNSKELLTYHRDFSIIAKSLLTNRILSGVQVASIYTEAFSKRFESKLDQLSQVVASLTQLMTQMVKGGESSPSSSSSGFRPPKPNRSNKCFWDNCDSTKFDNCVDLSEWVSKGRVERDENGFVQLKGGQRLPRIQRYTEDHPSEKSWLLESPQVTTGPLAGVDGFQGPSMLAKAASYMASPVDEEQQEAERRKPTIKTYLIKRRRSLYRNPNLNLLLADPEPSQPIPPVPGPTRPPKPIIGKLPPNYVPPQERTVGVPPKDDVRNFRYRAPIETEAAVERVVQAGLSSVVSIRQDDLLAIAPEYRRRVKENVTSRRIGIDGNLLEDIEPTYLLESSKSLSPSRSQYCENNSLPFALKDPPDPVAVFFQEFGDAVEGDGFYVAKESASIRGINALIGERSVHCVADSGCSIVAMSDATSNALGLSFDPKRRIPLQSANGKTDWTLGTAKDVPFRFNDIIAFLQVHIVDSPAYDVLLGRPFEILTQAHIKNFLSGDQHYTLTDPNTDKVVTIPTIPRELPRFRKEDGRDRSY